MKATQGPCVTSSRTFCSGGSAELFPNLQVDLINVTIP